MQRTLIGTREVLLPATASAGSGLIATAFRGFGTSIALARALDGLVYDLGWRLRLPVWILLRVIAFGQG